MFQNQAPDPIEDSSQDSGSPTSETETTDQGQANTEPSPEQESPQPVTEAEGDLDIEPVPPGTFEPASVYCLVHVGVLIVGREGVVQIYAYLQFRVV